MSPASLVIKSLIMLLCFFTHTATTQPTYLSHSCLDPSFISKHGLSDFLSQALSAARNPALPTDVVNVSAAGNDEVSVENNNFCRRGVNSDVCLSCVSVATSEVLVRCPDYGSAIVWYDVCTLQYTNTYLFGGQNIFDGPQQLSTYKSNSSKPSSEIDYVNKFLPSLIRAASNSESLSATEQYNASEGEKRYGFVQCRSDIGRQPCEDCLNSLLGLVPGCCGRIGDWWLTYPNCTMRYGDSPFYSVGNSIYKGSGCKSTIMRISLMCTLVLLVISGC